MDNFGNVVILAESRCQLFRFDMGVIGIFADLGATYPD